MKIVQLDSFDQAREYGTCWNDLLGCSVDNHVFLTLEWLETWWKHLGSGRELLLLAAVDNGKILAVAPLMATTYSLLGFKLRNIEFVGAPDSDYQSFLLIADSSRCAKMIMDHVKEQVWDCIELKNIPEGSETAQRFADYGGSLKFREREMDICPFAPLPNSFEEYCRKLTRKKRRELRRTERRLRDQHKLEYGSFSELGLTLEKSMDVFFRLHQLRSQSKGLEGKFRDPVFRNFHMNLAKLMEEKGWLCLNLLTIDSEPVAAYYGFQYRRKLYAYMCGFDPHYSRYGVGAIGFSHWIEGAIKTGLKEFDFLRGEHSYKEIWASETRRTVELSAIRWKLVSKAYEWFVRSNLLPSLTSRLRKRALQKTRS